MENLNPEQQQRIALLEAFEAITAPERDARLSRIDLHEQEFREKWLQLQSNMVATRSDLHAKLTGQNASESSIAASVAIELAKLSEGYYAEKDRAARQLDGELPTPKSWLEFLKESKLEQPDASVIDALIAEAEAAPELVLSDFSSQIAPNIVLNDLQAREGKDGVMEYARGTTVAVRDVGDRLDVRKTDDRDIEAALKIAAKKFDVNKGLLLTGDTAFKFRAAEISGQLGYPLQNTEPDVLRAWMRGKQAAQGIHQTRFPGVDAGISGDPASNLKMAPVGQSTLRADPRTIEILQKMPVAGVELVGENKISLPDARMLAAHASIKDLGYQAIHQLAKADLEKPDGGLGSSSPDIVSALVEKGLLDADGKLTPLGGDVVMVRDDRVIREREALEPAQRASAEQYFKTSGDYVREAYARESEMVAPEVAQEKADQAQDKEHPLHDTENAFQLTPPKAIARQRQLEDSVEL